MLNDGLEVTKRKEYGGKQYLLHKLAGYRAACAGIPRQRNWVSPVRPNTTDELGWFDGWDLAEKDGMTSNVELTGAASSRPVERRVVRQVGAGETAMKGKM